MSSHTVESQDEGVFCFWQDGTGDRISSHLIFSSSRIASAAITQCNSTLPDQLGGKASESAVSSAVEMQRVAECRVGKEKRAADPFSGEGGA